MRTKINALIVMTTFMFCHFLMRAFWPKGWSEALLALDNQSYLLLSLARYLFIYGPLVLVVVLLFRKRPWQQVLGLELQGASKYVLAASVCCLPMILGYASLGHELNLSISDIMTGAVYPGFFEELVFRAALFGVLFRFCRWGFIPAALFSSVIFGIGHMYQGHDLTSALLAFAVTAVGGTWFAWLYCECEYRLWFPIGMHVLMNGAYGIFGMSGGAAGDLEGNIFKASAIILSLLYVQLLKRQGKTRAITLRQLWRNQPTQPLASSQAFGNTYKETANV